MTLPLCERQIAAARDRATIVDNIPHTGPKRPISVSRGKGPGEDKENDLVCGQGRLEPDSRLANARFPPS